MDEKKVFKVGSRKSQLALTQTKYVINKLKNVYPDKEFEVVTMMTTGDKILDKPLPKIGEKSLFTRELEEALEINNVDFVVHSLKDLPTCLPSGLTIGAILQREDPRDVLILKKNSNYKNLEKLPEFSVIGTSSLRRCAQINKKYPNLKVESIRGNLNTRLKKLDEDDKYSGIILAAAGVKRMNLSDRISQIFEPDKFLYAVGQGALAVECNSNNTTILELLESLNHCETILTVVAERSFLKTLGGGCSAPVAVNSTVDNDTFYLTGAVWSLNGEKYIQKTKSKKIEFNTPKKKVPHRTPRPYAGITAMNISVEDLNAAEELGTEVAEEIMKEGALEIISEAKCMNETHISGGKSNIEVNLHVSNEI
ncbi:hypothetical protein RUM43_009586 [Polyplax serrata]|uniref:hydroxymethylbilane synthase n=1 Tax=Polyplax serrata TaxID=468196 RepID=A0AAN8S2M2_POLSC